MTGKRLVLLRHGQTSWNAIGRGQGHSDIELDELGHEQSAAVAPWWRRTARSASGPPTCRAPPDHGVLRQGDRPRPGVRRPAARVRPRGADRADHGRSSPSSSPRSTPPSATVASRPCPAARPRHVAARMPAGLDEVRGLAAGGDRGRVSPRGRAEGRGRATCSAGRSSCRPDPAGLDELWLGGRRSPRRSTDGGSPPDGWRAYNLAAPEG